MSLIKSISCEKALIILQDLKSISNRFLVFLLDDVELLLLQFIRPELDGSNMCDNFLLCDAIVLVQFAQVISLQFRSKLLIDLQGSFVHGHANLPSKSRSACDVFKTCFRNFGVLFGSAAHSIAFQLVHIDATWHVQNSLHDFLQSIYCTSHFPSNGDIADWRLCCRNTKCNFERALFSTYDVQQLLWTKFILFAFRPDCFWHYNQ